MRCALTTSLFWLLLMPFGTVAAQGTVSPLDVFLACRHPQVAGAEVLNSDLEAVRNLCALPVPRSFDAYVPVVVRRWTAETVLLPSPEVLRRIAAESLDSLTTNPQSAFTDAERDFSPVALFEPGSVVVSESAAEQVRSIAAAFLQLRERVPEARLRVKGFADPSGSSRERNEELATDRAVAVRKILVEAGVPLPLIDLESDVVADSLAGTREERSEFRAVAVASVVPALTVESLRSTTRPATTDRGAAMQSVRTSGSLPVIAANLLVEHAANQIAQYLLTTSGEQLCDPDDEADRVQKARDVLIRTCRLFSEPWSGISTVSVPAVINAVRLDLQDAPAKVISDALAATPLQQRAPAAVALARELIRLIQNIESGVDPVVALNTSANSLIESQALDAGTRAELKEITDVIDRVALAEATLPAIELGGALPPDSLWVYGLRSVAVANVDGANSGRIIPLQLDPAAINTLLALRADVERMRALISELRTLAPGTDATQKAVRELATITTDLGLRWLSIGVRGDVPAGKVLLEGTGRVMYFVRAQEYGAAAGEMAGLLQELRSTWCGAEEAECRTWTASAQSYRLLQLAADVANAQDDAGVASAMRGFLGTGRDPLTKRRGTNDLRATLNAYVGAGLGIDHGFRDELPFPLERFGFQAGLRIPIGIELHRSTGSGWSKGVLFSLVDLGNVATVTFTEEVEREPDVSWISLFSPGIFTAWGVPDTPFSIVAGWSFLGAGRTTTGGERTEAGRFSLFGAVDIPILP